MYYNNGFADEIEKIALSNELKLRALKKIQGSFSANKLKNAADPNAINEGLKSAFKNLRLKRGSAGERVTARVADTARKMNMTTMDKAIGAAPLIGIGASLAGEAIKHISDSSVARKQLANQASEIASKAAISRKLLPWRIAGGAGLVGSAGYAAHRLGNVGSKNYYNYDQQ